MCLNGLIRLARRAEQDVDATPSAVLMEHLGLQAREEAEVGDLYSHPWEADVGVLVIAEHRVARRELASV